MTVDDPLFQKLLRKIVHTVVMEEKQKMKTLANQIVAWMKNYAETSGQKAFVLGVSGGVDSALVSTLCAMTGLPTHCVILPCETTPDQTSRGEQHIAWLQSKFGVNNVFYHKIDLTTTFAAVYDDVCCGHPNYYDELGFANVKSRLRMIALYHIACIQRGLVAGTGNKVEDFGIGFFTKYGDGGVDISPIADLLKSEVRDMCRELNVLPELADAVPTDGLWADGRSDEDAIGATYTELEWAMQWLEDGKNCSSTVLVEGLTPRQKQVLEIYTKRHAATMHKLLPIPTFQRETFERQPGE